MLENFKLDVKDLKILTELDKNSRQSNSQIGKKAGLSKEVVKYRIDKLIEHGIIIRFHTVINYFKLGIVKFKLYLRLTNINSQKLDEICKYFYKHEKTEWVAVTTGKWDLIVGFLVKNANEFDDEVQEALNQFAEYIEEKAISTTMYLAHHTRDFLNKSNKNSSKVVYHTINDSQEKIDLKDEELLKIIANNARMPVTEIAKRLRTTPRVVQYKLRDLERRKIILAYKSHLDPKKMDRIFCKLIIYLRSLTKDRLNSFIDNVSSLPGAIWPQKVIGAWDFELDFELENYDKFQEVILNIKEKFSDIIKDHDFCIVSKEYKLDLFAGAHSRY